MINMDFYNGKKVLITGNTGFKGCWLSQILIKYGANVTGYSLGSKDKEKLFDKINLQNDMNSIYGDIRDLKKLQSIFDEIKPEIVFHLAAQPIVRESYLNPVYTYETNIIGTLNVLECARKANCVKSLLNVTTDKVYKNKEIDAPYKETDELDGFDPYSNSKSCSELVTHSYKKSFFDEEGKTKVSTARAGNVIGGGDYAKDRIIPDCVRAAEKKEEIIVRNPYSIRPYQHVLDPLFAYLMINEKQYDDVKYSGYYNVGPNDDDCITTGKLTDIFCKKWGTNQTWKNVCDNGPHEAKFLKLDCSKMKETFNWKPVWSVEKAIEKVVEFSRKEKSREELLECMNEQINEFVKDIKD